MAKNEKDCIFNWSYIPYFSTILSGSQDNDILNDCASHNFKFDLERRFNRDLSGLEKS